MDIVHYSYHVAKNVDNCIHVHVRAYVHVHVRVHNTNNHENHDSFSITIVMPKPLQLFSHKINSISPPSLPPCLPLVKLCCTYIARYSIRIIYMHC